MTVATSSVIGGPYVGNDVTVQFSFPFSILEIGQVKVYKNEALQVLDVDYSVDVVGSFITMATPPTPSETILIIANYNYLQGVAFPGGAFFPYVHEEAYDKAVFTTQQLLDFFHRRTLHFNDGKYRAEALNVLPDPDTGKALGWESDGSIINLTIPTVPTFNDQTAGQFLVWQAAGIVTSVALPTFPTAVEGLHLRWNSALTGFENVFVPNFPTPTVGQILQWDSGGDLINIPLPSGGGGSGAIEFGSMGEMVAADVSGYTAATQVTLFNYHADLPFHEGATYYYDPTIPRAVAHDGVTIIAPGAPFPVDWQNATQRSDWYAGTGLSGTGCFVLKGVGEIDARLGGARGDDLTLEDEAIAALVNTGYNIFFPAGIYQQETSISLGDGQIARGEGPFHTEIKAVNNRRGWTFIGVDVDDPQIRDLLINCAGGSVEGGIFFNGVFRGRMDNVIVKEGHLSSITVAGQSPLIPATRVGRDTVVTNCYAIEQRQYVPGGVSPFIAGDGALRTTFHNCYAIDCQADGFDNDASHDTIFSNCYAIGTGTRIPYFGFWSEGQEDPAGYTCVWDNCHAINHVGGFGAAEFTKGMWNNCHAKNIAEGLANAFRHSAEYPVLVTNFHLTGCDAGESDTNGIILCERAGIFKQLYFDNCAGNNFQVYSASGGLREEAVIVDGVTVNSANTQWWMGYGNEGPRYVTLTNFNFTDCPIRWFDSSSREYKINQGFTSTPDAELALVNGARVNRAHIDHVTFVKIGTTETVRSPIEINIDTFNTYISNCRFVNYTTPPTNNGVLLDGNRYDGSTPLLSNGNGRQFSDLVITSDGTANATDINMPNMQVGYYEIEGVLIVTTSASAGFLTQFAPTGADDHAITISFADGDGATATAATVRSGAGAGTLIIQNATTPVGNTKLFLRVNGHVNLTSLGSYAFSFGQDTSSATGTTLHKGSWLRLKRTD